MIASRTVRPRQKTLDYGDRPEDRAPARQGGAIAPHGARAAPSAPFPTQRPMAPILIDPEHMATILARMPVIPRSPRVPVFEELDLAPLDGTAGEEPKPRTRAVARWPFVVALFALAAAVGAFVMAARVAGSSLFGP
jgi:hypothetical protein